MSLASTEFGATSGTSRAEPSASDTRRPTKRAARASGPRPIQVRFASDSRPIGVRLASAWPSRRRCAYQMSKLGLADWRHAHSASLAPTATETRSQVSLVGLFYFEWLMASGLFAISDERRLDQTTCIFYVRRPDNNYERASERAELLSSEARVISVIGIMSVMSVIISLIRVLCAPLLVA